MKADPVYPPRKPKPDEQFLVRVETLRTWRKMTAKKIDVKSDVVLPRDVMYAIAARNPNSREQLAEVMEQLPWRFEEYGDQILATLSDF